MLASSFNRRANGPRGGLGMAALLLLLALPLTALAQPKPGYSPSSTHIFPAGGRRGSTVKVRVGAECIPPGTQFSLHGEGVTAPATLGRRIVQRGQPSPRRKPTEIPITYPKQWASQIDIAAGAPLGPVYWRLSCAQGGTGSRPFVIGDLPEWIETESNSTASNSTVETAERVTLPVTLNGQIHGERDEDYYRFAAKQRDVVVCEVLAARLGSRLDPIVELTDAAGHRLNVQTIHVGSDPLLALRVPADGEYLLRVANVSFRGDPANVYRINLSTRPYVQFAFPAGGQRGTKQPIEFFTLSGTSTPRVIKRTVEFPKTLTPGDDFTPTGDLFGDLSLAVDDVPNIVEQEPNGSRSDALKLSLPVTVNGRFLGRDALLSNDVDWFCFDAKKDQKLSITCRAAPQAGSAMPTVLLSDAAGKQLATARSVESADGVCRIDWTAPADGSYYLRLRDLRFGARGGPAFVYRLSVRPAKGDFALSISADCFNLVQGKTCEVPVSVLRSGRFSGAIDLKFEGLPKGVKIEGATIAAGASSGKVKLTATDDVPAASTALRIVGTAQIDGKTLERIAAARHLGVDSEGVALASPSLDRLHLTIVHKPVFRLECFEAYQYAHRGSIFLYPMQIQRLDGFDAPVTLQIGDRQNRDLDGIEMREVVIPPGSSQAMLPIYLPETMHINVQSQSQLYAQAWASFTDRHSRRQSVLVLCEKRNMLRTLPPVAKLKVLDAQLTAQPGGEVTCRLRLERTDNFTGPAEVELLDPPNGVSLTRRTVPLPKGRSDVSVTIRLADDMPLANDFPLKFRLTGRLDDRMTLVSEATARLRVAE